MSNKDFTAQLNECQLEAVNRLNGPLLVLAGAGTGKTKVLTSRVANIINSGIFASNLLVVTFTNKASREMHDRIANLLNSSIQGIWLGTFHSIGAKILRKHANIVGLQSNFTIIDSDDQLRLIKQIIKEKKIDDKKNNPKALASIINSFKDAGVSYDKINISSDISFDKFKVSELYKEYQLKLIAFNAVDFGDLLLYNLQIFLKEADILHYYQNKFKYILVDEYQDTNIGQYLWLRLLAQSHHNICCVGDDDQSIYGWRGAEVGNILKFEKDFKDAKIIRLEQNYRSTSHILAAASHLISHNSGRLGKTLWTKGNEGDKVEVNSYNDDVEESNSIADKIDNLRYHRKTSLNNIAILVRAGYQTRIFEEAFISRNLAYKIIGGLRFYDRMEIKDSIAYLRIIYQPFDMLAFERIANIPKRGIGNITLQNIIYIAGSNNISALEAIKLAAKGNLLKGKAKQSLLDLTAKIEDWRTKIDNMPLGELTGIILEESGYIRMWKLENTIESKGRLENIKELLNVINDYNSLEEFLEHVSLVVDKDNKDFSETVNIMTLHAAKGLEFEHIFLPGWEQGIFPNQRTLEDNGLNALEEERRLAYVGITRAKKHAYISFAARRRMFGRYQQYMPSCFIEELPVENININNADKLDYLKDYNNFSSNSSHQTFNNINFVSLSSSKFKINDRIFHIKFGYGKIINIDGDKLEIKFEKSNCKTIIDKYVELA